MKVIQTMSDQILELRARLDKVEAEMRAHKIANEKLQAEIDEIKGTMIAIVSRVETKVESFARDAASVMPRLVERLGKLESDTKEIIHNAEERKLAAERREKLLERVDKRLGLMVKVGAVAAGVASAAALLYKILVLASHVH